MPQQLNRDQVRSGGVLPPERRGNRIAAVVTVVLAALLSGSAPQVASTGRAGTRVVPPMYRLMNLSGDQDRRIAAARDALVTSCMAAHGRSYVTVAENVTDEEALAALRPFGLESLENLTTEPLPPEPAQDERYVRALFGDPGQRVEVQGGGLAMSLPANGCTADAEHHLLGNQRLRAVELRLRIFEGEREAREQLDHDPAFVTANERWSRCVHRFGVEARTPGELVNDLPADTDLATDPAVRADVHCKRETGYLDTAYARLAVLQQNWLDAHADLVAEWLELRQRQHTAALGVLR
jgi:hypothetical protein